MVEQVSVFQAGAIPLAAGERPLLNEARLSEEERVLVGAYLEAGAVVMHTTARGIDILRGDERVVPLTIRTDGEYVWAGPVTYYVQTYGVAPDADFLEHVRARGYEIRVPDAAEIQAAGEVFAPRG
ncbi:hypothetical protein [Microbacterium sp. JZ31]|uniref:hypothetical protein n=1 Tax=Microbacterium sp. JZ31 TaxID=1906274 RepID=UPI00193456C9|nr:hypothetical protein [Microbacterium sp. JZ31]